MKTRQCKYPKIFILILLCIMGSSFAVSHEVFAKYEYHFDHPEPRNSGNYEKAVGDKLTRGLTNVGFGWTELALTPTKWKSDPRNGMFSTMFVAVPYGFVRAIGRSLTGVYEVVTAYAPQDPIFYPLEGDKL